jgi:ankyrin repeat protein
MTALMKAAQNGHKDTVRMLLDAGADPFTANKV